MKRYILFIVFAIVLLFPLSDLFTPGIPMGHDTPDHVARIANFCASLSEGNIVPRWAANLNWGYGHPILMFLYPLPSYMACLIHGIGFGYVDSVKLVFAISYIASVLAMYAWASRQFGRSAGIVASVLYGFAPYRFVDLYVRGALGEHVAFVFPPLILLGLYHLARKDNTSVSATIACTALVLAFLILSHNAVSIMFLPVFFLYALYLFLFETKIRKTVFVGRILTAVIMGFALSAFFWIPAFFEGRYTLRDIVTKGEFTDRFVPWHMFFRSAWSYGGSQELSKEIGIAQWISIIGSIIVFIKHKTSKFRWMIAGLVVIFTLTLWIMTPSSAYLWRHVSLLAKFQFPWRFLTVSVFLASVAGAVTISRISKHKAVWIAGALIIIAVGSTQTMWKAQAYRINDEPFYTGIYHGTTDTGESSPIWSVRFMEHIPAAPLEMIEGAADIMPLERTSTVHTYNVNVTKNARLVENTLYFPGWHIRASGIEKGLQFQDPSYRGLMTFWLEEGEHTVKVVFRETKLRLYADIISLTAAAGVLIMLTRKLWNRKNRHYQLR